MPNRNDTARNRFADCRNFYLDAHEQLNYAQQKIRSTTFQRGLAEHLCGTYGFALCAERRFSPLTSRLDRERIAGKLSGFTNRWAHRLEAYVPPFVTVRHDN